MKDEDKPLWYAIFQAFPPKYEPRFDRPAVAMDVKPLLYPEDVMRANFYKSFGNIGTINMAEESTKAMSQVFIERCEKILSEKKITEEEVFQAVVESFEAEGLYLDRSRAPTMYSREDESEGPVEESRKLSALFEEAKAFQSEPSFKLNLKEVFQEKEKEPKT